MWTWCFTNADQTLASFAVWIPGPANLLMGLRALAHHLLSVRLNERANSIEQELGVPEDCRMTAVRQFGLVPFRTLTAYVFWFAMAVLTYVVPVHLWSIVNAAP